MIDFILGDMKPRPVCVDPWRRHHRPLQPRVVTRGKVLERDLTDRHEFLHVLFKGSPSQQTPPIRSKVQGDGPSGILFRRERPLLPSKQ